MKPVWLDFLIAELTFKRREAGEMTRGVKWGLGHLNSVKVRSTLVHDHNQALVFGTKNKVQFWY